MGGRASLWMNCANAQDGDAVQRDVPGAALAAPRPITSANAGGLMGCGKIRKAAATVAAPDSYPHVICGCPVTGRRPPGVVAAVAPAAPKARHGIDDNTGTLAASEPARRTGPRSAGPRPRCPAILPGISDNGFPTGHLGGKNIPFTKAGATTGRRPAAGPPAK